MKIGFIDSGFGGLLLASHIYRIFPESEIIYIGDTKNMPYGEREVSFLNTRYNVMQDLAKKLEIDLLVVACNTLSATSYHTEQKKVETIDIISLSINYLNNKNLIQLSIIATPNTVKSEIYKNNLKKNINLNEIPTKLLASFIEANNLDAAEKEFENLIQNCGENILLGCTHYSVLKPKYPNLNLFSQDEILSEYLNKNKYILENNSTKKIVKIYINAEYEKYQKFGEQLFGKGNFELELMDF